MSSTEINYHPGISFRVKESYEEVVATVNKALDELNEKKPYSMNRQLPIEFTNSTTGKRVQLRIPDNVTLIHELPE